MRIVWDRALHGGGVTRIHGTGVLSVWTPALSHGGFVPFGPFPGPQWFSKECYIHNILGVSELFLKLYEQRPHQRRLGDINFFVCSRNPLNSQNTGGSFRIYKNWDWNLVFNHLCLWELYNSNHNGEAFHQSSLWTKMNFPTKNVFSIFLMILLRNMSLRFFPLIPSFYQVILLAQGIIPYLVYGSRQPLTVTGAH